MKLLHLPYPHSTHLINRHKRGRFIRPAAAVDVGDTGGGLLGRTVRMTAKNIVGALFLGEFDGTFRGCIRNANELFTRPLHPAAEALILGIEFLNKEIARISDMGNSHILGHKTVELVSVRGVVLLTLKFPQILLHYFHTKEMREYLGGAVVIANNPNHLAPALGMRKLADMREHLPVILA